jgi:hypothetical protein
MVAVSAARCRRVTAAVDGGRVTAVCPFKRPMHRHSSNDNRSNSDSSQVMNRRLRSAPRSSVCEDTHRALIGAFGLVFRGLRGPDDWSAECGCVSRGLGTAFRYHSREREGSQSFTVKGRTGKRPACCALKYSAASYQKQVSQNPLPACSRGHYHSQGPRWGVVV